MEATIKTISIKRFSDFDSVLNEYKNITGDNFYECYENHKAPTEKRINSMRIGDFMIDNEGNIFYVILTPEGLQILNKLTISSCLHDAPFHPVMISKDSILIDVSINYDRSNAARNILAARKITVTCL